MERHQPLFLEKTIFHIFRSLLSGKKLARNGLDLLFDAVDRGKNQRVSVPIFIARGKTAEYVLGVIEPLEMTPGKNIISTTKSEQKRLWIH